MSTSFADRVKSSQTLDDSETKQYLANSVSYSLCNLLYFSTSVVHSRSNYPHWQTEGDICSQTVSIRHCLHFAAVSEKDVVDGYVMLCLLCAHLLVIMWFALRV